MATYGIFRSDGSLAWSSTGHPPTPDPDAGLIPLELEDYDPEANVYMMVDGAVVVTAREPLALERTIRLTEANSVYSGLINAGFTYSGNLYQIDPVSQGQITAMGALAMGSVIDPTGSPWDPDFYWITADNSHVSMDAATTYTFARAVALYVSGCVLRLRAIKDTIAAAEDPTSVDVTAGYPSAVG